MTPDAYFETEDRGNYPPTQLVPLGGGRYKTVFHGPPGTDVGDLHCDLVPDDGHGMKAIVNNSGWLPDEAQVAMLQAGAHVRLSVWAHPIPPLAVNVEPPVCECHGEKMDFYYDGEEGSFECRHVTGGGDAPPQNGSSPSALERTRREFRPANPDSDSA